MWHLNGNCDWGSECPDLCPFFLNTAKLHFPGSLWLGVATWLSSVSRRDVAADTLALRGVPRETSSMPLFLQGYHDPAAACRENGAPGRRTLGCQGTSTRPPGTRMGHEWELNHRLCSARDSAVVQATQLGMVCEQKLIFHVNYLTQAHLTKILLYSKKKFGTQRSIQLTIIIQNMFYGQRLAFTIQQPRDFLVKTQEGAPLTKSQGNSAPASPTRFPAHWLQPVAVGGEGPEIITKKLY